MSEPNRPEEFQKANGNSNSTPANGESSVPSMPFDLTGLTLGEFHLLRRLGKGGMAEVWLAEQTSLRRQVAVKILRPDFVADASYVKRFKHEATAAGSLNHPNIVQVYMVGEENGIHFIAQEYVQGRNLKEFITRKGPLEVPIALHILKQVAAALQVAATSGIVHRDIKPENVLLTKKGEAKVADFGLAQLSLHGEKVALTQVGVTMGTPLYMSPEQVNGKPLDARSDIYSMGVMAWHMLAGRPPFSGDTALAVAVKHLNETAPSLKEIRPDVPPGVVALIDRMMSKKREDRPADAQAVANDLKSLLRQATGKETAPLEAAFRQAAGSLRAKKSFLERPLRQQMWWMVGASALVMASTAGIGWAMRTPDPLKTPITTQDKVMMQSTVEGQIYHAQGMVGKPGVTIDDIEAAWIEVRAYKDVTPKDKHRADLNLALIYLKTKRQKQAEFLANLVQSRQMADAAEKIVLVGDFNAFEFNDGYVNVVPTIMGIGFPDNETVVSGGGADLVNPDLTNLGSTLPANQRYSYSFDGNAQELDHILITGNLLANFNSLAVGHFDANLPETDRNNANVPDRISDHDGLVAYFTASAPTPTPTATPTPTPTPTPAFATVDGRVLTSDNRGLRNATVSITDSQNVTRLATTSSFGFFSFDNVSTGAAYTFRISSRFFRFSPRTVQVDGNLTLADFLGLE